MTTGPTSQENLKRFLFLIEPNTLLIMMLEYYFSIPSKGLRFDGKIKYFSQNECAHEVLPNRKGMRFDPTNHVLAFIYTKL